MKILTEGIIILGSLAISILAGYFLYTVIEEIRLDMYCKEFREGLDCYQEGWKTFPTWLFSLRNWGQMKVFTIRLKQREIVVLVNVKTFI